MFNKVLCYIDSFQMGGAERVMANLCNAFVNDGRTVIIVNDILPNKNQPEYPIPISVKRLFLEKKDRKNSNYFRIKQLRRIIKTENPDIIVSFLGPPNLRAIIANIGLKTRLLVSVRNDPNMEYGHGIKKTLSRILFHFADGHVFQTQEAASYFPRAVQKKSRIIVNPINEKFYNIEWNGCCKEIAVVGRLQPQKNPLLAVEAFRMVSSSFPDYKLVFYGDDELKEAINKKSIEYGLCDKIIIYGKCSTIEKKLSESALFLLTSDYEGMPNALLEAMAVGVPVISTDCPCGGPREITMNGKVGILTPCRDPSSIAKAISSVLSSSQIQIEMSKAERERALDFREEIVFRKWNQYINEITS